MWHITQHAALRMDERGISKDDLFQILNGVVPALIFISDQDELVDLYFGRVGEKFLMIPVDRISKSIITVRPMRKKEKEIFFKGVQND